MMLTLCSCASPVLAVVLWLLIIPCILSSSRMSDDFCLSVSCKGCDLPMNPLVSNASWKDENIRTFLLAKHLNYEVLFERHLQGELLIEEIAFWEHIVEKACLRLSSWLKCWVSFQMAGKLELSFPVWPVIPRRPNGWKQVLKVCEDNMFPSRGYGQLFIIQVLKHCVSWLERTH